MADVIPMKSPLGSSGGTRTSRVVQIRGRGDHNRLALTATMLLQKRLHLLRLVPILAFPILPALPHVALRLQECWPFTRGPVLHFQAFLASLV